MRSANPYRGEVALALGDNCYVLRPSFAALVAAEAEAGPVLALAQQAAAGNVCLETMACLFHHCILIEDGRERPTAEAIGAAILEQGMVATLESYRSLLERILGGFAPDD